MKYPKFRIEVDAERFMSAPRPPLELEGVDYGLCRNWIEAQVPAHRLAYHVVESDFPKRERRSEIKQTVVDAINRMGSHFFVVGLRFDSHAEAKYAASLWKGKSPTTLTPVTTTDPNTTVYEVMFYA